MKYVSIPAQCDLYPTWIRSTGDQKIGKAFVLGVSLWYVSFLSWINSTILSHPFCQSVDFSCRYYFFESLFHQECVNKSYCLFLINFIREVTIFFFSQIIFPPIYSELSTLFFLKCGHILIGKTTLKSAKLYELWKTFQENSW